MRPTSTVQRLREFYLANPSARPSREELAEQFGCTTRTIENSMNSLRIEGKIRRVSVYEWRKEGTR